MKITSYEISKKLAEIGFKKGSNFRWYLIEDPKRSFCTYMDLYPISDLENTFFAYDVETILDALPESIKYTDVDATMKYDRNLKDWYFQMDKESLYYVSYYHEMEYIVFCHEKRENESLADTAARLLILLHEKGIVKFNN
jgi:hypothetical protein